MALGPISRAARYREIAYRPWRMSTDRSLDIGFETRNRLATIADNLEDLAERVEDKIEVEC
jgi:hypothetical protein